MDNIKIICKKELAAFFGSPVGYIVLVVFASLTSWFFASTFFLSNQSDLRTLFDVTPMVFTFYVPAITMGLVARERQSGTLEFLTTLPLSDLQIIFGKYLAALILIKIGLAFTLVHAFTLFMVGQHIDVGALIMGYFGLVLVGAMYSAIGVFCSSITNNQIVSFIVSFVIVFFFFILEKSLVLVPGWLAGILQFLSVDYHLNNISRGVLDTRNLIYFGSVIAFFLLLSTRILEMRKWK